MELYYEPMIKSLIGFQLGNSKCQVLLVECSRDYDVFWPMDVSIEN